jgi:hypothetical protein
MIVSITAAPTEYAVGKWSIPVALVAGSPFTFDVGQQIAVGFVRSGDNGINGAGGDMFGANNLSELANKATAFSTIKQPASLSVTGVGVLLRNYLSGFQLSNDVGDLNNDISITPGMATDATNVGTFGIDSTVTKQLDVAWSPGDHAGGLDTGTKANSTWYYIFAINRPDINVTDYCFSINSVIPTFVTNIPVEYSLYRRIGQVRTNSSGNITGFIQYGDMFTWKSQFAIYSGSTFSGTLVACNTAIPPLNVPPVGIFGVMLTGAVSETNFLMIMDPAMDDVLSGFTLWVGNTNAGIYVGSTEAQVRVDSLARVKMLNALDGRAMALYVKGYIDIRGKNG